MMREYVDKTQFEFADDIHISRSAIQSYEYGTVNIVASSKNLPCGSIVRFSSNKVGEGESFAIVLDRGVRGYSLDLLTPSEEYASKYIGRSQITYDVLRSGWE